MSEDHRLAEQTSIDLRDLQHEFFELWPRDMVPATTTRSSLGVAPLASNRAATRESSSAAAWAISQARGVALIVKSLESQVPHGVRILPLRQPSAPLPIDVVWATDPVAPAVERFGELARDVADRHGWLPTTAEHARSA